MSCALTARALRASHRERDCPWRARVLPWLHYTRGGMPVEARCAVRGRDSGTWPAESDSQYTCGPRPRRPRVDLEVGGAMTSQVLYASAHVTRLDRDATLPAKFQRLLEKADLAPRFGGKRVALKMHVGSGIGFYTIHPLFVRQVVDAVEASGRLSLPDGWLFSQPMPLWPRGYTPEVVGARVVGRRRRGMTATTIGARRSWRVARGRDLRQYRRCGRAARPQPWQGAWAHRLRGCHQEYRNGVRQLPDARCHPRPHVRPLRLGGGAITHCEQCIHGCPTGAVRFNEQGQLTISEHHCRYCMHCTRSLPHGSPGHGAAREEVPPFPGRHGRAVKETLAFFDPANVHLLHHPADEHHAALRLLGLLHAPLVPDIGALASDDIVAIEQAALDLIDAES